MILPSLMPKLARCVAPPILKMCDLKYLRVGVNCMALVIMALNWYLVSDFPFKYINRSSFSVLVQTVMYFFHVGLIIWWNVEGDRCLLIFYHLTVNLVCRLICLFFFFFGNCIISLRIAKLILRYLQKMEAINNCIVHCIVYLSLTTIHQYCVNLCTSFSPI